jgi:hypothetical protein
MDAAILTINTTNVVDNDCGRKEELNERSVRLDQTINAVGPQMNKERRKRLRNTRSNGDCTPYLLGLSGLMMLSFSTKWPME